MPALALSNLLRLPTTILVLASVGFLGLGEQPPTPEWSRLLSENQPYVELAPWTVAGPAVALVLLAVAAVGAVGTGRGGRACIPARGRRSRRGTGSASGLTTEQEARRTVALTWRRPNRRGILTHRHFHDERVEADAPRSHPTF
ncbi:hypothetical protein [Streptomyces tibetensis]|uniref:hypothetical protein n=1 Tax=Streptomyces tibetensis TaxID=2382123 RepID=UPI003F4D6CD7